MVEVTQDQAQDAKGKTKNEMPVEPRPVHA